MERASKCIKVPILIRILFVFLFAGAVIGSFSDQVFAEGDLNFSVKIVEPKSQFGEDKNYFDVNLPKGEKEELVLKLRNASDQPIKVAVSAHTAFTNSNGVVEYGADEETPDSTLKYAMKDLLETPKDPIELQGNQEKEVSVKLTMPKEEVEGLLAGGIYLEQVEEDETKSEGGMVLGNKFSYVVGVVASNDRSQTIKPELELLEAAADQQNGRNVFRATIQNYLPTFTNQLKIDATISKKGSEDILYQVSQENMQMAPNSHMDFPISLNGDRFRSGTYVLKMTATSGENEWEWDQDIEVTADEAKRLNKTDVLQEKPNWLLIGLGALVVLLILGWIGDKLYHKHKRKKEQSGEYPQDDSNKIE